MTRQGKVDWNKAFPVSHVTREDIVTFCNMPRWQCAKLTDEDMVAIASRMGDLYCDNGYAEDILNAVEYVVGELS